MGKVILLFAHFTIRIIYYRKNVYFTIRIFYYLVYILLSEIVQFTIYYFEIKIKNN